LISESLERLTRKVEQYDNTFRNPNLSKLELLGPYCLFPDDETPIADASIRWDQEWPNSRRAGVYIIFSKDGTLLYVGKAWFIGRRLADYFRNELPLTKDRKCRVLHDGWTSTPMYVVTVAAPKDSRFEAAGLEEYLITELKPCDNLRM